MTKNIKSKSFLSLKYIIIAVVIVAIVGISFSFLNKNTTIYPKQIDSITSVAISSNYSTTQLISYVGSYNGFKYKPAGTEFYNLNITNTNSRSIKISSISASNGFLIENISPKLPFILVSGETQSLTLTIFAPTSSYNGTLALMYNFVYINSSTNTTTQNNTKSEGSNALQITGSSLTQTFNVSSNGNVQITGNYDNITLSLAGTSTIQITGSYDTVYLIGGSATVQLSGSYNNVYYSGTNIINYQNSGSYNSLTKSGESSSNSSSSSSSNSSSNNSCYITEGNSSYFGTTILAQNGQTCQLQSNYYESLGFTTYGPTETSGTFTVNNGIEVYVLNDQELQQYNSTGQVANYLCLIGTSIISGSLNCEVPAGSWNIVFINNNQASSEITFTSNITVSYVSYAEETPSTIVSQGTNWNLNPNYYQYEEFTLNSEALISGEFSSSNTVEGYILNQSEFSAFETNGSALSYYCTTGEVISASISCEIGPGTWYFVLSNPSSYNSASVNWQTNLTADGLSYSGYTDAPYDEQFGLTFADSFTVLTYNVTAVAQQDTSGIGPAYLLNGLSNTGYWYQIGLSYNWPDGNQHYVGFDANYEVFSPSGTSIYPPNGGGGLSTFNGPVNPGDTITLTLYFSGGNVIMDATDINTGAQADFSYSAEGANEFVGNPTSTSTNGFFTGLMTEWYHTEPWYGPGNLVTYNPFGAINSPAWMWVDEFFCYEGSATCPSADRISLFYNSTSNVVLPSYTFDSNAAQLSYLSNGEFTTGTVNSNTQFSNNSVQGSDGSSNNTLNISSYGSCGNFELSLNSANQSKLGQCTWGGGNLTVSDNEGQFQGATLWVNSTGSSSNIYSLDQSVYDYPSCSTDSKSYYFPAGTYNIYIRTGSVGISCANSHAYVDLSVN